MIKKYYNKRLKHFIYHINKYKKIEIDILKSYENLYGYIYTKNDFMSLKPQHIDKITRDRINNDILKILFRARLMFLKNFLKDKINFKFYYDEYFKKIRMSVGGGLLCIYEDNIEYIINFLLNKNIFRKIKKYIWVLNSKIAKKIEINKEYNLHTFIKAIVN